MTPRAISAETVIAELDALIGSETTVLPPSAERSAAVSDRAALPSSNGKSAGDHAAPADDPPAAAPEAKAVPAGASVLVVDDNEDYRKVVTYLLKEHGYSVIEAKDGAQGLRQAKAHRIHMALLDFEMPGLNGYELIQEFRGREETRRIPILMLTGARNRRQLKELGMNIQGFLEKPIANDTLLAVVDQTFRDYPPDLMTVPPEPAFPASEPSSAEPAPIKSETPVENADDKFSEDLEENADAELLIEEQKKEREEVAGLDVLANDSPLVNRVNKILIKAVDMGASDIHVEPQEKRVEIRVRVHGTLRPLCQMPLALAPQIAARVKIMSNLVITERRRPQDGQIRAMIKGKKVEFRISTIPSLYGEKIVMRVLGGAKLKPSLKDYNLSERDLEVMTKALESPHGLLLVTGPTGSGKTTTLYTMIRMLNTPDVNIMTAEDPVEYELSGITQVQVKAHIGLTFESILRSFLRQDPDIMLIGEIRDLETVEIAVKAAITGHLVLSTLHTNSAPASVMRLAHMGVATYLLADSLKLIVAQRLVRTLCKACRVEKEIHPDFARMLTEEERRGLKTTYESPGCAKCDRSGYSGRTPLFEIMEVRTPEIRQAILSNASVDQIAKQAAAEGMTRLRQAALQAVAAGETSVEEAMNIILSD